MSIGEALNISTTGFIVVLIVLAVLACIIVFLSKIIRSFNKEKNDVQADVKNCVIHEEEHKIVPSGDSPVFEINQEPVTDTKIIKSASAQMVTMPNGLTLYKVTEKQAATIMAIISHESGIPLNKLAFNSIKLDDSLELYKTDDKTAATIMAIISHQTEIPLDKLVFKSIKLIEE